MAPGASIRRCWNPKAAALSAQARRTDLALTVLDRAAGRYSREVEASAYFCVLEAMQNAVRHAHAQHAHIELDGTGSTVTVKVSTRTTRCTDRVWPT